MAFGFESDVKLFGASLVDVDTLADDGDATICNSEATSTIVVVVHPYRGTRADDHILVENRTSNDGVGTNPHSVEDYGVNHCGAGIDHAPRSDH